jgi:hypothetical protein
VAVLDRIEAEVDDPAALLSVTVLDPACGSGHFLLAAARRIARRIARVRAGGVASPADYGHALRDVARSCLFGVDRNPMAVELTKVALWIETVEPGKPLGFLDANIRCGDALLGVFDLAALAQGIPDVAYKPLAGDDKEAAKIAARINREQREGAAQQELAFVQGAVHFAGAARAVAIMPEDDLAGVEARARAFQTVHGHRGWWAIKTACDLYIAAFLVTKRFRPGPLARAQSPDRVPTSLDVRTALAGRQPDPHLVARAVELARAARAFHWPLEFPAQMLADHGKRHGFDVVLGNPPWERIKLQEQEFFASREPEIAEAPNAAARGTLIAKLKSAEPGTRELALFEEFEAAKRAAEASSVFARVDGKDGGRFPLTGRGDVNTYALFAELFGTLASKRGRAGMIVPTGIATDATTAPFFAALVDDNRLAQLIDFENRNAIFPAVHRSYKFSLMTIGRELKKANFAFFLTDTAQLAEPERHFTLSADDIARINPNTKTAPIFRSRADAELTAKIYARAQILMSDSEKAKHNDWGAYYLRLIDFSDHKDELVTAGQAATRGFQLDGSHWRKGQERLLLLWESKLTNAYDLHYASFASDDDVQPLGEGDKVPERQVFRYWVSEPFFESIMEKYEYRKPWLLAYRDVARSTDERSVIALAIPREPASRKLPILGWDQDAPGQLLLANLDSISFDYVARQKLGGISFSFFILKQLPVIPMSAYSESDISWLSRRVLELTFTSPSMAPFARDLDYEGSPFAWDENRRALLRAELDAWYARAYGLTRDELRYILDPADVKGADYPSETFRVLKTNEIRRFGEYRTARLVLQAWDRLHKGELAA